MPLGRVYAFLIVRFDWTHRSCAIAHGVEHKTVSFGMLSWTLSLRHIILPQSLYCTAPEECVPSGGVSYHNMLCYALEAKSLCVLGGYSRPSRDTFIRQCLIP